jgi:hypothetical protein
MLGTGNLFKIDSFQFGSERRVFTIYHMTGLKKQRRARLTVTRGIVLPQKSFIRTALPFDVRKALAFQQVDIAFSGYAQFLGAAQIGSTAPRKREALPHISVRAVSLCRTFEAKPRELTQAIRAVYQRTL